MVRRPPARPNAVRSFRRAPSRSAIAPRIGAVRKTASVDALFT
jgi:hypothetical protein